MADENEKKDRDIDFSKILLPKKEVADPHIAQRVNAAVLLEREQKVTAAPTKQTHAGGTADGRGLASDSAQTSADLPGSAAYLESADPAEMRADAAKRSSVIKPLETYRGAIEEAVQKHNLSVISIAAAEARRRGETSAPQEELVAQSGGHDLGITIAAIAGGLVLIAAAAALFAYLFIGPRGAAPARHAGPQAPFIAVDEVRLITILPAQWQRPTVMEALDSARSSTALSLGLIAWLYISQTADTGAPQRSVSAQDLLMILAPNVPDDLLRALTGEYLLGVHSFDGNQAFLILGVESYEAAYRGMLDWELAMPNELEPLFSRMPRPRILEENIAPLEAPVILPFKDSELAPTTPNEVTATAETIAAPAASSLLPEFFRTRFVDRVVENHDARVIQDEFGDILLLWAFLDRNTLAITTNEYTLREIISRRSRPPVIPL